MSLTQTITGFDVWHLALPVTSRRDHGIGSVAGACEIVVLRLTADSGLHAGMGRSRRPGLCSPVLARSELCGGACTAISRPLCHWGPTRTQVEPLMQMAETARAVAHCTEAKAALECRACWTWPGSVAGDVDCP